jgi:hypothetical protein
VLVCVDGEMSVVVPIQSMHVGSSGTRIMQGRYIPILEGVGGGVHESGINVSKVFQTEECCCVVCILLGMRSISYARIAVRVG